MSFCKATATFTRPGNTDAYADGDLIANSTTAGSVEPMRFNTMLAGRRGKITRVGLFTDAQNVTLATYAVHLFGSSPTVTNGDNGAFAVSTAVDFLGTVVMDEATTAFVTATDKKEWFAVTPNIVFHNHAADNQGAAIYGLLAAGAAYVPASAEVFTMTLEYEF